MDEVEHYGGDEGSRAEHLPQSQNSAPLRPALCLRLPTQARRRCGNLALKLSLLRRCRARPGAQSANARTFYTNVYPSGTHFEVTDEPPVAIRKFSPCGRYLVTFSKSPGVYSLIVYRLRRGLRTTSTFPAQLWSHYFEEHFTTNISQGSNLLNKDFCLFSESSKFLFIASTKAVNVQIRTSRKKKRSITDLEE